MIVWTGQIYYAGPYTRFRGVIDEREIIYRIETRWRWLTMSSLRAKFRDLDPAKCGYALLHGGVCIEQYDPPME